MYWAGVGSRTLGLKTAPTPEEFDGAPPLRTASFEILLRRVHWNVIQVDLTNNTAFALIDGVIDNWIAACFWVLKREKGFLFKKSNRTTIANKVDSEVTSILKSLNTYPATYALFLRERACAAAGCIWTLSFSLRYDRPARSASAVRMNDFVVESVNRRNFAML